MGRTPERDVVGWTVDRPLTNRVVEGRGEAFFFSVSFSEAERLLFGLLITC